jgi:hypothetical protein
MTGAVRFPLGQLAITANATTRLSTEEVLAALRRHACGDWGDLCPEDTLANDSSLEHGGRLLSAYGEGSGRFWIITESDRSVTTILLPEDSCWLRRPEPTCSGRIRIVEKQKVG